MTDEQDDHQTNRRETGRALHDVAAQARVGAWAGSAAFLLWRSVYIVKQVATRNRVLVTFDWVKTALFGRDITRL